MTRELFLNNLTTDADRWAKIITRPHSIRMAADTLTRMADPAHAYMKDSVRYWKNNDAIVPPHVYRDAGANCPAVQREAYDADLAEFTAEYRRNAKPLSGEALAEARANHEPGTVLVDVLSGVRTVL